MKYIYLQSAGRNFSFPTEPFETALFDWARFFLLEDNILREMNCGPFV